MPSGLDHCNSSSSDPRVEEAHQLYHEFLTWTRHVDHVICMGDMNETLTAYDRYPSTSVRPGPRLDLPIQTLEAEGFVDAYRVVNTDARLNPGFTHFINSLTRCSRSRIDYIWIRGLVPDTSIIDIHIDHHSSLCVIYLIIACCGSRSPYRRHTHTVATILSNRHQSCLT